MNEEVEEALSASDHDPDKEPDLSVIKETPTDFIVLEPSENGIHIDPGIRILEKLPNSIVSFKLVEDSAYKLVSLKEIDTELAKDGTIDRRRADIVAESSPSLFQTIFKGSFTSIPTKASFRETRAFISNQIAKEEVQLMDVFKSYIEDPFKTSIDILTQIKETYLPGLVCLIESLKTELEEFHKKVLGNKEIEDFLYLELRNLDSSSISTKIKSVEKLKEAVSAIQSVFKVYEIGIFFKTLAKEQINREHVDFEVSIKQLSTFIMNPQLLIDLRITGDHLEYKKLEIEKLVLEAKEISDKPEQITAFVVKNAEILTYFHQKLTNYSCLVYHLTILNLAIKQVTRSFLDL